MRRIRKIRSPFMPIRQQWPATALPPAHDARNYPRAAICDTGEVALKSMIETIQWTDAGVVMIDQTRLPLEEKYVTCRNYEEVAAAIRDMIIRGAPAIGV